PGTHLSHPQRPNTTPRRTELRAPEVKGAKGVSMIERNASMPQPSELIGKAAPKFDLPSSTGNNISLDDFKGKQTVVLYFYPRADTPGCTKEACGSRDALADYDKARVAVLGISPDEEKDVTKFKDKFRLNFPLLADGDHAVAEKYGV